MLTSLLCSTRRVPRNLSTTLNFDVVIVVSIMLARTRSVQRVGPSCRLQPRTPDS